ncbi:MAG: hypothetical protein WC699_06980 [Bacteroidales bacterium]
MFIFRSELLFSFFISLYVLFVSLIGEGSGKVFSYQILIWFFEGFIVSSFIYYFNEKVLRKDFEVSIVLVGLLASFITIIMIISPTMNAFISTKIVNIVETELLPGQRIATRGFALAESPMGTYGTIQGLIAVILLNNRKKGNYLWLFLPVLIISIIFNQRLGLFIFLGGVILLFFFESKKKRMIVPIFFFIGFIYIMLPWLRRFSEVTYYWILYPFYLFFGGLENLDSPYIFNNTVSQLAQNELHFPETLFGKIFGEGAYIYSDIIRSSDIGYVNYIYIGGALMILLLIIFQIYMYKRYKRAVSKDIMPLFITIIVFVITFKGLYMFWPGGLSRLIVMLYAYAILKRYNLKKNELCVE